MAKLKKLESQKFAYTTGVEESEAEKKSQEISRSIKSNKFKTSIETVSAMQVPPLKEVSVKRLYTKDSRKENYDKNFEYDRFLDSDDSFSDDDRDIPHKKRCLSPEPKASQKSKETESKNCILHT